MGIGKTETKQEKEKEMKFRTLIAILALIILPMLIIGMFVGEIGDKVYRNSNRLSFQTEVELDKVWVRSAPVRRSLGVFIVTAYCPCGKCCGRFADGITANCHQIQKGDRFCASDKSFPFGIMLDISGYGFVPVWDRGSAITGNRLDVFFDTHEEALRWGRQELEIFCWLKENEKG